MATVPLVQYVSRMSTAACTSLDLSLNKILLSRMHSAGWCLAAVCVLGTRTVRVVGVLVIDKVEWCGSYRLSVAESTRKDGNNVHTEGISADVATGGTVHSRS